MTTFWLIIGVVGIIGILAFKRPVDKVPNLTPDQVAELIEKFIDGTGGPYDWDDYINIPSRNPSLEQIRRECVEITEKFPPEQEGEWCSATGIIELKRLAQKAKQLAKPTNSLHS